MTNRDKDNQFYVQAGGGAFPSHRGVPAGRGVSGVLFKKGEEHPVASRHPSKRGEWHNLPFNPKLKQRSKELRKAGNLSEVLFWNQVKNKKFLGLDFDRQKIIGNYIVDFYCKDLGVVLEIDGGSHDEKQEYDEERDNYLESFGLKIFHIQDIDVKKNLGGVMEFLREHPVIASQCHPSMRGECTPSWQGKQRLELNLHGKTITIKDWPVKRK